MGILWKVTRDVEVDESVNGSIGSAIAIHFPGYRKYGEPIAIDGQ